MNPTLLERAERIRACVIDVLDHGVNLLEIGDAALWGFVGQQREYFQAMLGYDPTDAEIVHLLHRVSPISPVDTAYMVLAEMRTAQTKTFPRPPAPMNPSPRLPRSPLRARGPRVRPRRAWNVPLTVPAPADALIGRPRM